MSENAILMVFCDRNYEAEDYIRDYSEFLKLKELGNAESGEVGRKNQ